MLNVRLTTTRRSNHDQSTKPAEYAARQAVGGAPKSLQKRFTSADERLSHFYTLGRFLMSWGWVIGLLLIFATICLGTIGFLSTEWENHTPLSVRDALYKAISLLAIQTGPRRRREIGHSSGRGGLGCRSGPRP